MSKDELIKILEEYEMFVDDDFGGSYESIIAYAPNKTISRAHTPIAVLNIIDTFEKMQQENRKYKEIFNKIKKLAEKHYHFESDDYYDYFTENICLQDGDCREFLNILKEVEHD